MRRFPGLLVAAVLLTTAADSQSPVNSQGSITSQNAANSSASRTETSPLPLQTSNQLLDVVVLDKAGLPVRGLKPNSFSLTDSNEQQTIARFQEHSSLGPVPQAQPLPKMPAGTFTDYTPVPPDGTLNILLLDALNTPTKDQNFIRNQLTQYVNQANPGTRIAIFGLANHLILLQGFTSDPATLKNIADHKLIPRSSSLLNRHADSDLVDPGSNDANAPAMSQLAANLQQFEAQTGTLETALRPNFTLDAFNTLARYLSAFPGRKNLIWFSGSFPLNLLPQPELNDPFASAPLDQQEYRETINLLRSARVAVYPVNALGVPNAPTSDAVGAGHAHQPKPEKPDADLKKIGASEATERSRMGGLASSTGGVPFDTANSLATAVASVVNAGSNYYTLSYNPANPGQDGSYRKVRVDLAGDQAAHGLQLCYRPGYYTAVPLTPQHDTPKPASPSAITPPPNRVSAYIAAAMSRGAPTPQNLLFKVRVLPSSNAPETSVAPHNSLDPSVSPQGPFRRYDVDFVTLPSELTLTPQPDGNRMGKVEFLTYVFDLNGRLLNATGKTFTLTLSPANYDKFLHSAMEVRQEISVPTLKETFIRIGVRDVSSNKFGVVEIPTVSISRLAPAPHPSASPTAPAPSTPPSPAPAPSTISAPATAPSSTPQR